VDWNLFGKKLPIFIDIYAPYSIFLELVGGTSAMQLT
jgi:hypothetical protein